MRDTCHFKVDSASVQHYLDIVQDSLRISDRVHLTSNGRRSIIRESGKLGLLGASSAGVARACVFETTNKTRFIILNEP